MFIRIKTVNKFYQRLINHINEITLNLGARYLFKLMNSGLVNTFTHLTNYNKFIIFEKEK
jgi:hypothetical protein